MERVTIVCAPRTSKNQSGSSMLLLRNLLAQRVARSAVAYRAVILVVGLFACSGAASDSVTPSGNAPATITITPNTPAIPLGSQLALQAQVHDAGGQLVAGATIFWSSSDTGVVAVSSTGVVTGKNVGIAQVAASAGGQSAIVAVAVVPVAVASVAVLPSTATLSVGGTVVLQAVASDAEGHPISGRPVVWASSAPQVATIDTSGTVTAVSAGTATVTGTSGGKTASATITVTVVPIASVAVVPGSAALTVGQAASFSAVATDANGNILAGRQTAWSSANAAVATVSSLGLVTAVAAGTTTIRATAGGQSGIAQVVVTAVTPPPPTAVASVVVNPATTSLTIGGTATLSASVRDASGATLTGRTVTWSTSASQIATVSSSGVITAIAAGTATIAAASEGKSGTATVTVQSRTPAPAPVASIQVSPATLSLQRNQTGTLTAHVFDASGNELSGRTIAWSSSDDSKISVTPTGASTTLVAHNHNGTVTITATSEGITRTANITVTN